PSDLSGSLSCRASTCLAAAGNQLGSGRPLLARSVNGGASWTVSALCRTWHRGAVPGVRVLFSVTCPTTTFCLATASSTSTKSTNGRPPGLVVMSNDGGRTWTTVLHLPVGVQPLSAQCVTATTCMIGGDWQQLGGLWTTTNGAKNWTEHVLPKSIPAMAGFSCLSESNCLIWANVAF